MDDAHTRRWSRLVRGMVDEPREAGISPRHNPHLQLRQRARSHPRFRPRRLAPPAHDERDVGGLLESLRCLDEALVELEREAGRPHGFERVGGRLVRGFERRAALVARLPFGLGDLYRVLATRHRSPIATVATHGTAGGCRARPAGSRRAAEAAGGFFFCGHCGRIVLSEAGRSPGA